jgi:hypothetical protein
MTCDTGDYRQEHRYCHHHLHVQVRHLECVPRDEVMPGLHDIAHQRAEHLCGVIRITDLHLEQRTDRRVQCRLPKLIGFIFP